MCHKIYVNFDGVGKNQWGITVIHQAVEKLLTGFKKVEKRQRRVREKAHRHRDVSS